MRHTVVTFQRYYLGSEFHARTQKPKFFPVELKDFNLVLYRLRGFPPVAGMSELILCLRGIEGKHIERTISRTHIGDVSA